MTEEIDIWRSAKLLIDNHGADAELHAAQRVDAMISSGDPRGESVWKQVLAAVKQWQKTNRSAASLH